MEWWLKAKEGEHIFISTHGRAMGKGLILNQTLRGGNSRKSPKGKYPSIGVAGCRRTVHSLVAETFIGPKPKGMVVCHNDGNPLNNHLNNIRYDTQANNNKDKVLHGTNYRITNAQLDIMFEEVSEGKSVNEVSSMFGVCRA